MANIDISQGSQGFGTGIDSDLGGTAKGCIMGGSRMGFRFPSPLSMPCVVPFPDQALYPVGVGDSGLVLTEHSQFHLLMQDQSAPEQKKNLSTTSVQQKLSSASDTQFSQFANQIEHNESPRAADP